jgi:hypothetical protein
LQRALKGGSLTSSMGAKSNGKAPISMSAIFTTCLFLLLNGVKIENSFFIALSLLIIRSVLLYFYLLLFTVIFLR